MSRLQSLGLIGLSCVIAASSGTVRAQRNAAVEYRVLATSKTSTMEKELNLAAEAGFRFVTVMGGETAIGGKEAISILSRRAGDKDRFQYKLLATSKTSSMQKEMQQAADAGFEYRAQTVFETILGGKEVVCIMERDKDQPTAGMFQYRLLATTKTSTMQKELQQIGDLGYEALGMTIADTLMGGKELVTITRKQVK